MATQNKPCDVQFSLRVPSSIAEDIAQFAENDGMRPAAWIRRIILEEIRCRNENRVSVAKSELLSLLENDLELRDTISRLTAPDLSAMQGMECQFARLRQVTERRLSALTARRRGLMAELAELDKDNRRIIEEMNALTSLPSKNQEEAAHLQEVIVGLSARREMFSSLCASAEEIDAEIAVVGAELIALASETEQDSLREKWGLVVSEKTKSVD